MTEEIMEMRVDWINLEQIQKIMQTMGYRVTLAESDGSVPQLHSASQGIGFSVRPGNLASQGEGAYLDFSLSCALRITQGELPKGLVNTWNASKRFARLSDQGSFLVLEMDTVVAGGVTPSYVRANIELWDRLMSELVLFLRTYLQQSVAAEGAKAAAGEISGDAGEVLGEGELV